MKRMSGKIRRTAAGICILLTAVSLGGCTGRDSARDNESAQDNESTQDNETAQDSVSTQDSETAQDNGGAGEISAGGDAEAGAEAPAPDTDEAVLEAALAVGYGDREQCRRLYENRKPAASAEDFTGEWLRTQVHTGCDGTLTVEQQTDSGFSFAMDCYYFFHSGYCGGEAFFVTPQVAVSEYVDEFADDGERQYIVFVMQNGAMTVRATGADFEMGLGNRVFLDGSYSKEEPVYTNAGQLEEYFAGEIEDFMKRTLSPDDYSYFSFSAETGYVSESECTLEGGVRARDLEVFMPTAGGYGFRLIVTEDGTIYAQFDNESIGFITNDDDAVEMPEPEESE